MAYEATGSIKVVFDTQTFPSGFTKREFVLTDGNDKYPQDLKFEVVKDKCEWLDKFQPGQTATVHFDIRGNEFKEKYYVNLNCWKITSDEHDQTEHSSGNRSQSNPTYEPDRSHKQDNHPMPDASKLPVSEDTEDIPF